MEFAFPMQRQAVTGFHAWTPTVERPAAPVALQPTHAATPFSIEDILSRRASCISSRRTIPCHSSETLSHFSGSNSTDVPNWEKMTVESSDGKSNSESFFSFTAVPTLPRCTEFAPCMTAVCGCGDPVKGADSDLERWPFLIRTSAGYCIPSLFPSEPTTGTLRNRRRKARTVFVDTQLRGLEARFQAQKYLSTPERIELAQDLRLSETQVKTWFQNRRMKLKKDTVGSRGRELQEDDTAPGNRRERQVDGSTDRATHAETEGQEEVLSP